MDLKKLFVEDLNYELVSRKLPYPDLVNKESILDLELAFEKKGFNIICCKLQVCDGELEKAIIKSLKKEYSDALYIFSVYDNKLISVYNFKLTEGGQERIRKITYDEINNKTKLFSERVRFFEVTEDITGRLSLKEKIDYAFDIAKVTKRFYDEYKKHHDAFIKFIKGITIEKDVQWYASVLLNRVMFIYFIQKKGFINNDYNYLRNKFSEIDRQNKNFYSDFLINLFFMGFATKNKSEEFEKKYGNVPYLNGGLFLPHPIESRYKKITVDNKAFKDIIDYFDKYVWYLDERPLRNENEINPDILGYIFEKYINQKELGAYYTKEDITGYISKNTIIPFIFNKLGTKNYGDFLNKISLEDYIYEGVEDEAKKTYQNWKIKDINDFVTFNLDLEKFTLDFINKIEDENTVKHLYFDILKNIKILDPTGGSGAFLFAALNILFPIYEKIINKKFLEFKRKSSKYWRTFFEPEILNINKHPNVNYFILKTIIVNNLYGVDIVEEATEICKLRLFLKLAAQIEDVDHLEPLPDIDFNIKAGNTLIGVVDIDEINKKYTYDSLFDSDNIKTEIVELDKKLVRFRNNQLALGEQIIKKFDFYQGQKEEIQRLLSKINLTINKDLQSEYGEKKYESFIDNYKPFNWYVEFNEIIKNGGFDVIIGNPPYVEYAAVRSQYQIRGYKTKDCGNLYAFVIERALNLLKPNGSLGMILPLGIFSTQRMEAVVDIFRENTNWASFYGWRPSHLFEDVNRNLCILISTKLKKINGVNFYTTTYKKWAAEERENLFKNIIYYPIKKFNYSYVLPKINNNVEQGIIDKIFNTKKQVANYCIRRSPHIIYYRNTGGLYWKIITDFQPAFYENGRKTASSRESHLYIDSRDNCKIILSIFNSNLFWWFYTVFSDCWVVNPSNLKMFPLDMDMFSSERKSKLSHLVDSLMIDIKENAKYAYRKHKGKNKVKFQQFCPRESKHIIDKIDCVLAEHYGFNKEEVDFIINYDIKFRMGQSDEDEE